MNHTLTHTKEKNHACRACGKVFARRDHLKLHMFKHTGGDTISCLVIGYFFVFAKISVIADWKYYILWV